MKPNYNIYMKQRFFLLFILSIIISCSEKTGPEIKKYPLTENTYSGAFDTFYQYIKTLNNNELNDDNMSELFN